MSIAREESFPIIPEKGVKPHPTKIPWWVADMAYSSYAANYGRNQSLERIAERGGFYASEMDSYLPDWRERCDVALMQAGEIERLQRENAELREAIYGKSDLLPALKQEELRRCLEQAVEIVSSWPAWKQGILQHSSEPMNKEPRKPIGND